MLQYLYGKARLEAKQAESAVRDARKRSCCEAEWMAAVTHLAGRRDNLEWQLTKKRRLDEDAVVILDTGGKVELDKRAKKANDKFREEEERAESASSSNVAFSNYAQAKKIRTHYVSGKSTGHDAKRRIHTTRTAHAPEL